MSIFGIPLAFFLPLIMHIVAGLTTGIIGAVAFSVPKRRGRHSQWGVRYLGVYTVVFLTATMLSIQHWKTDAYLLVLAVIGYGLALAGYAARRWRLKAWMQRVLGKQWMVAHTIGMIGSYAALWTAFFVDNADQIPLLNQMPLITFWVLPTIIASLFLVYSLARFPRKYQRMGQ